jgi:predicted nucleic acid-binding protein
MTSPRPAKPRVFVDADALFAGAASPTDRGASLVILRLAEITLIEAVTSRQVVVEVERNLTAKLASALPVFRLLVSRCLHVGEDPEPAELAPYAGLADSKDLPILATALREKCQWLVTFNVKDYQPGHPRIAVLRPGEFVLHIRDLLTRLASWSPAQSFCRKSGRP